MQAFSKQDHNNLTRTDQCQYGIWIEDTEGWTEAMKPTKFLTNSSCIAEQLRLRCAGERSHATGTHASLFDGRSAKVQVYPDGLCDAIRKGIKDKIEHDRHGQLVFAELNITDSESGMQDSHTMYRRMR